MSQERMLSNGVEKLAEALHLLMEVKNEVGVDMANKVYKAIRVYEKHQEKLLKEQTRG